MNAERVINNATSEAMTFARDKVSQCIVDLEGEMLLPEPNCMRMMEFLSRAIYATSVVRENLIELTHEVTSRLSDEEWKTVEEDYKLWLAGIESEFAQMSRRVGSAMEMLKDPTERSN